MMHAMRTQRPSHIVRHTIGALALALLLLSSTWPELELHDGQDAAHAEAIAGAAVHNLADVHGEEAGLHLHACSCAAHCSALPSLCGFELAPTAASPVPQPRQHPTAGIADPPFRPPIA